MVDVALGGDTTRISARVQVSKRAEGNSVLIYNFDYEQTLPKTKKKNLHNRQLSETIAVFDGLRNYPATRSPLAMPLLLNA